MTVKEFKEVARLLKDVYKELRDEALEAGINPLSIEYDTLLSKVREETLSKLGFSVEDYRRAKDSLTKLTKDDLANMMIALEAANSEMGAVKELVPSDDKISEIAEEVAEKVAKKYIKEPVVINKIVKEVKIKEPKIVKETIKIKERVEYDDKELKRALKNIKDTVDNLKIPSEYNDTGLKQYFHDYFSENFKKNIDTLGMPDFRKLAMGLREDIDKALKNTTTTIKKRVQTATDTTSITPDGDNYDCVKQTNTQVAGTLTINAPTGTPSDFQKLQIKINSTNAQTFSWNSAYRGTTDIALSTTIGAGKEIEFGFEYHSTAGKWDLIALTNII